MSIKKLTTYCLCLASVLIFKSEVLSNASKKALTPKNFHNIYSAPNMKVANCSSQTAEKIVTDPFSATVAYILQKIDNCTEWQKVYYLAIRPFELKYVCFEENIDANFSYVYEGDSLTLTDSSTGRETKYIKIGDQISHVVTTPDYSQDSDITLPNQVIEKIMFLLNNYSSDILGLN